jgi:beta-xylosidase
MARDEVDLSLITNDRRKRKLPSYVTDQNNISADKDEVVKRMKHTLAMNPSGACEQSIALVY